MDIGLDSDSQTDDELDIGLDSDLQADDELDIGLDSDLQADDELDSIDLENFDENSPNNLDQDKDNSNFLAEDIPESFLELGDDLEDFDLPLDGEGLGLDEADLDSLAGDKKSYNNDLEGLLG